MKMITFLPCGELADYGPDPKTVAVNGMSPIDFSGLLIRAYKRVGLIDGGFLGCLFKETLKVVKTVCL